MKQLMTVLKVSLGLILMVFSFASWAEPTWIDVRSPQEYQQDHIEGDILIPHQDIVAQVQALYPSKTTSINLYCRSGGRAGKAKTALEAAGYTNVKNVGGINDARKQRSIQP